MALKKIQYDVRLLSTEIALQAKVPAVYTNDLNSAEFVFNILEMTPEQLAGATATTLLYMRDGSFFQNSDVNLNGNTFTYLLKENEGNHIGLAKIQLVVKIGTAEYASQLYSFEVVNGLETKVAKPAAEVIIQDWTTLLREARAYIAQFLADEEGRQATFVANEQDRQLAFEAAEALRQQKETERQEAESGRIEAEVTRQAGYDADHGRAETDHTTAETDHTTAVADHAIVQGFNARLTAEETATANNKISAVKGKTFADVDARFEDVEADTTLMGTNIITNGDFSKGTTGWRGEFASLLASNNILFVTGNGTGNSCRAYQTLTYIENRKYYVNAKLKVTNSLCTSISYKYASSSVTVVTSPVANQVYSTSAVFSTAGGSSYIQFIHNYSDGSTASGKVMELQNATLIDLTATFGVGNEPTAEQMDAIMAKFPNSWFDGTRNLFSASETLKKQIAIDSRTEFNAKNLVVNGDFSNGTTGWDSGAGTVTVANNILSSTATGEQSYSSATQTGAHLSFDANAKIYIKAKVRVTNSSALTVSLQFRSTSLLTVKTIPTPSINQWYEMSGIISSAGRFGSSSYVRLMVNYADVATALGKVMEVQYVSVINLTATFGADKEPTLAEMDRLMARFPNSWFDGTKQIQTIKTLYQEKANNVQEAWITPTLINGWNYARADEPLQFMKDTLGFVRIRGTLAKGASSPSNVAFTLPVGYRPKSNTSISVTGIGVIGVGKSLTVYRTGIFDVQGAGTTEWYGINMIFDTNN